MQPGLHEMGDWWSAKRPRHSSRLFRPVRLKPRLLSLGLRAEASRGDASRVPEPTGNRQREVKEGGERWRSGASRSEGAWSEPRAAIQDTRLWRRQAVFARGRRRLLQ